MNRIFLTGDKHGDMKPFKPFSDNFETTNEDVMVILGDAGGFQQGKTNNTKNNIT